MKDSVESDGVRAVNWQEGGRWGGLMGDLGGTRSALRAAGANVDCSVWVMGKDEGAVEELRAGVVEDGGEVWVLNEETKSVLEVLSHGGGGFSCDVELGWLRVAVEDLLEGRFPGKELVKEVGHRERNCARRYSDGAEAARRFALSLFRDAHSSSHRVRLVTAFHSARDFNDQLLAHGRRVEA